MPHKVWQIGEEVIASDFNTYVQQQVVEQFPNIAARTAAITAPVGGQPSYIDAGNETEGPEFYNGAAWRKPWNLPWGVIGAAGDFGQVVTSGATEAVLMAVPSFNTVVGRRLKITADFTGTATVAADLFKFGVRRGATTAGTAVKNGPAYMPNGAGFYFPFTILAYDIAPATGSVQYMIGAARMGGTGTFTMVAGSTYSNSVFVEDLGPAVGFVPA